jgi:two-component system sensor histidine kinase AtoS
MHNCATNNMQLIHSAAHDIASPLSVLQMCLDIIKEVAPPDTLNIMHCAVKRIHSISKALLMQHNHITTIAASSSINLVETIKQMILEKNLEWRNSPCLIETHIDTNAKEYLVHADSQSICKMLSNLLNNAYESMCEQSHIIISLRKTKKNIILGIQDLGCGIEKNKIQAVMNGYTTKEAGHGLGLSNAIRYMSSLNGKLRIKSIPKTGTLVELIFHQS